MYICDECGEHFEEPVYKLEDPSPPGVMLPVGFYEWFECPYCESDRIHEARRCGVIGCDNWTRENTFICKKCRKGLCEELDAVKLRYGGKSNLSELVQREFFDVLTDYLEERS